MINGDSDVYTVIAIAHFNTIKDKLVDFVILFLFTDNSGVCETTNNK